MHDFAFSRASLRIDVVAGLTVAVVALPLAIGFGVTSGMTASAGISTAIVAGILAAIFGGSKFQVSGPTGAMTVILIPVIHHYGVGAIPALGLMAGIIVMAMGFLHLGDLINRVPWIVVEGFTVGIAIVIALQQLPYVFQVPKGLGDRTVTSAIGTVSTALHGGINWMSVALVAATLIIKFNVVRIVTMLRIKFYVPASFIALTLVSIAVAITHLDVARIGNLPRSLIRVTAPESFFQSFRVLLIPAIMIALLVAIESLLSARVADNLMHVPETERFRPNQELFGQGLATAIASMLSGMPATGAIARTNVNVRSQATSRLASLTHAIFLLLIVLLAAPIFGQIPMAAIAGVLIGTSFRILNPVALRELLVITNDQRLVFVTTMIMTVAVDLIWGIGTGLAMYVVSQHIKRLRDRQRARH